MYTCFLYVMQNYIKNLYYDKNEDKICRAMDVWIQNEERILSNIWSVAACGISI